METTKEKSKWWQITLAWLIVTAMVVGTLSWATYDMIWPSGKILGIPIPDLWTSGDAVWISLKASLAIWILVLLSARLLLIRKKPHPG